MINYLTDNEQNMVSGGMEIWYPDDENDLMNLDVYFESPEELNKFLDFYTREHVFAETTRFRQNNLADYSTTLEGWDVAALVPIVDVDNFLLSFPGVSINDGLEYYLNGHVYDMSED